MKFTKKPLAIEAVQFKGINSDGDPTFEGDLPEWLIEAIGAPEGHKGSIWVKYPNNRGQEDMNDVLETTLQIGAAGEQTIQWADDDDWIIRDENGDLQLCKPDIFDATYNREVLIEADKEHKYRVTIDFSTDAEFINEAAFYGALTAGGSKVTVYDLSITDTSEGISASAAVVEAPEVDGIERPAPVETFGDVDLLVDVGMDGQKWARAFLAMDFSPDDIDEGLMLGWFANAIMAGYDEAQRRYEQTDKPIIPPEIMVMANALIGSKAKFDFYAESHDAKNTPEADIKAEVNREMSAEVERALTGWMIANRITEFGGISIDGERLVQNVELDTSDALPIPATDYMQVPADVFSLIYAEAQRSDDPLLPELNAVVEYENKSRGKTFVIGKGFVPSEEVE